MLRNAVIILPPRCPQCRTDTPHTIEDGGDLITYLCRTCGHVWTPAKIEVRSYRMGWVPTAKSAPETIDPEVMRLVRERLLASLFQQEAEDFLGMRPPCRRLAVPERES